MVDRSPSISACTAMTSVWRDDCFVRYMPDRTEKSLKDLLIENIRDIFDGEKQISKALPRMVKAAESRELRDALDHHLQETRTHISRLEASFDELGIPARGKKCEGIAGLLKEGTETLSADLDPTVKDAGIIAAAQKVEHYEIACYGTLVTWAKQLRLNKVAALLAETLDEEKASDETLISIATGSVNKAAA